MVQTPLLFVALAALMLCCHAQVMPAVPANFMSSFRWSVSGGGGVYISNGYYWTDSASNHTRWQYMQQAGSGPAVNITVWRTWTPTPNYYYYYFYQYATCSRYLYLVQLSCQAPRYLGQRIYNGQQAQAFLLNCTTHTRLWLFSASTQQPLELLITEVNPSYTSITSFSSFAINQAVPSLFQLPSNCPSSNRQATTTTTSEHDRAQQQLPPDPRWLHA